ncbi:hypothetical protein Pelo_14404 [Pelomyxa schiedti]|nr:hypothetical protein Pelo_14404 [Pelomyxa schiedti]
MGGVKFVVVGDSGVVPPVDAGEQIRNIFLVTQDTLAPRGAQMAMRHMASQALSIASFIACVNLLCLCIFWGVGISSFLVKVVVYLGVALCAAVCMYIFLVWYARYLYRKEVVYTAHKSDLADPISYYNQSNGKFCLLAIDQDNDQIVSMAFLTPHDPASKTWKLTRVGTLPRHQGRGHATRLVTMALDVAQTRCQASHVMLTTSAPQEAAVHIYSKLGFVATHITPLVFGVGELHFVKHF